MSMVEKLQYAGLVVLVGVVIVFLALIGLTFIFWLYGKAFELATGKGKNKKAAKAKEKEKNEIVTQALKNASADAAAPVIENGISDEVVAVISAAVASMMGTSGGFAIKSVKRAPNNSRRAWSMAGIMQNTRPF